VPGEHPELKAAARRLVPPAQEAVEELARGTIVSLGDPVKRPVARVGLVAQKGCAIGFDEVPQKKNGASR
jgi:hypothetical protein